MLNTNSDLLVKQTNLRVKEIKDPNMKYENLKPNKHKLNKMEEDILQDYTYYSCMDARMYPSRVILNK